MEEKRRNRKRGEQKGRTEGVTGEGGEEKSEPDELYAVEVASLI